MNYPFEEETRIDAMAVYCSDPRFQTAFRSFLEQELGLERVAPIVIPGSVSALAVGLVMPKRLKVLRDYVEFMLSLGGSRLILINHEDCRMYDRIKNYFFRRAVSAQQVDDLLKAASLFQQWVPALRQVEVYMARLTGGSGEHNRVYFEKVL